MIFRKKRKKTSGLEKRRYSRLKSYCLVRFQKPTHLDPETARVVNAKNLSEGGLMIQSREPIAVETVLKVSINIPSRPEPVEAFAKVMRASKCPGKKNVYDIGIAFVIISETDRSELVAHLAETA